MINSVSIIVIPHALQRYATTGDWQILGKRLHVTVSDLGDWRMNLMVGIHEVIEAVLCTANGITQKSADEFDVAFEAVQPLDSVEEPGDDERAPYYLQHQVATGVERTIGALLGVDWNTYERANLAVLVQK